MLEKLQQAVKEQLKQQIVESKLDLDELTLEVKKEDLLSVCQILRDHDDFQFVQLIDLCGVDYLTYGQDEWATDEATVSGFERGRETVSALNQGKTSWQKPRFAVVYHLLSITLNQRIRLKVFVEEESMMLPTVVDVWAGANWFEREAFDLYGLLFEGHPDLRRILTDYGFIGHPFRKDFPVIGELEMRYDDDQKQCIYEPVTIEERTLVAKVIRKDNQRRDSSANE